MIVAAKQPRCPGIQATLPRARTFALLSLPLLALAATLALTAPPARAQATVHRCEDGAGRVTYSNEACPAGTRRSREVDTSEPVAAKGAAPRAADEKASAERTESASADKSGAAEKSRAAEARVATARSIQIDRSPTPRAAPVSVRKDALCRDLATRVRFARQDLEAALPSQRASAELALRRAQEEHDDECRLE